ncbi:ribonuclease H2 non-catalytic subunit-domain-containing protein [Dunaliella salina]|uniref:Ribonuclease H2 non-catalytic subunit-domain-containing protein n=1 Tax=Dunaliella salina TaxID=3046 RepID=A0ABQ7H2K7_DUNSA|nr:ribonuclease H2 non-catalytic subunit-domain-containing protein [Dunaliella salina]|eukprot:KAF5841085.1 ribonuclease H2 non-catalytic subunit-domain-containing protein [Dunaliella salina]
MSHSKVHLSIHSARQQQPPAEATLHWLPCKTGQSCDADVAKLFNPTIQVLKPSGDLQGEASSSTQPLLEASFRGRQLRGQRLVLPPGYKGFVTTAGAPSSSVQGCTGGEESQEDEDEDLGEVEGSAQGQRRRPCKHWIVRHTFDSVTYWNHDTPPGRSDLPRRVFDWMAVAKQVHQPVSREQVEEQMRTMQL